MIKATKTGKKKDKTPSKLSSYKDKTISNSLQENPDNYFLFCFLARSKRYQLFPPKSHTKKHSTAALGMFMENWENMLQRRYKNIKNTKMSQKTNLPAATTTMKKRSA